MRGERTNEGQEALPLLCHTHRICQMFALVATLVTFLKKGLAIKEMVSSTLCIALHLYIESDIVVHLTETGPGPIGRAAYKPQTGSGPVGNERVPSAQTCRYWPNLGN